MQCPCLDHWSTYHQALRCPSKLCSLPRATDSVRRPEPLTAALFSDRSSSPRGPLWPFFLASPRFLSSAALFAPLPPFPLVHRVTASGSASLQLREHDSKSLPARCAMRGSLKGRRGQRFIEAPGDNRKVYGFGLVDWRDGWFDGRIATGRTADVFCEQVRAAVARSKRRGRVAIVIADNLKAHTPAGSLLVRGMLTELKEQLYLVYTPAYDPDANRIEWLWRISRRVVTHNHQRPEFELLVADVDTYFQALARSP